MKYLTAILMSCLLCVTIIFPSVSADTFEKRRQEMVENDIKGRGIKDKKVLDAMLKVQRQLFVDESQISKAYNDYPLPIGEGQTISQPYIVALMTEAVALKGDEKVLEIGTGSGYQAAILGEIAREVYTIEIKKELADQARERLKGLGYKNITVKPGDGFFGWKEYAPFDVIMVTAAGDHIPPPLLEQLKEGGRLIMPVGRTVLHQNLTLVIKEKGKTIERKLGGVVFVPMTGEQQKK